MSDQEAWYIRREFGKARPFNAADTIHIKVRSQDGESRWVALSSRQFELILNTLAPLDPTDKTRPTPAKES